MCRDALFSIAAAAQPRSPATTMPVTSRLRWSLLLILAACGAYPRGIYQQAPPPAPSEPAQPSPPTEPGIPQLQIPWPGDLTGPRPELGEEGVPGACADLVGRTFLSERDLPGGMSPAGPTTMRWTVRFDATQYIFSYTDVSEQSPYECHGGGIVGLGPMRHTGRYDPASRRLEWDREMYVGGAPGGPGPASPPPPRPSTPPAPPPPPNTRASSVPRLAQSEQEARGCTTVADCVITCAVDGDCCRTPCGCSNALNRNFAARLEANHAQVCRKQFSCPAVGCAMETYSASCVQGLCVSHQGLGGF